MTSPPPAPAAVTSATPAAVTVVVTAAGGGLGATVLATALAVRAAARGLPAVVAERHRGGLDVVCGIDGLPGLRLDDLRELEGEPDAARLHAALPRPAGARGPAVLAHLADAPEAPLPAERLDVVLHALATRCGLLVVDAGPEPPGRCDAVVLLTGTAPHRLAVATGRTAALARTTDAALHLAAPRDPEIIAEHLGADAGHRVRRDPGVDRDLAAATLPGRHARSPLARDADRLLDALVPHHRTARTQARRVAR